MIVYHFDKMQQHAFLHLVKVVYVHNLVFKVFAKSEPGSVKRNYGWWIR